MWWTLLWLGCSAPTQPPAPQTPPTWVGDASCASCHPDQSAAHRSSHHAQSTRPAQGALPDGTPYTRVVGVDPVWQAIAEAPDGPTVPPDVFDVLAQRWTLPDRPDRLDTAWSGRHGGGRSWARQCAPCHETASASVAHADGTVTHASAAPNVGCEACHGPGSAHLAAPGPWPDGRSAAAPTTCLPCHTRGATLAPFQPGAPWLDVVDPHLPSGDGVLSDDGQTLAEAFEGVPYLLSAMSHAGIGCLDCHDAHGEGLLAPGDALCTGCHRTDGTGVRGGVPHAHHAPGTPGSACVDCHMPPQTFLGADVRHDHRLQVPDVAWAAETGSRVACDRCHPVNEVLVKQAEAWWGTAPPNPGRDALARVRNGALDAEAWSRLSPAWRATVLAAQRSSPRDAALLTQAVNSSEDLDRLAAAHALFGSDEAASLAPALLTDARRAVRLAAGRALTPTRSPSDPTMSELLAFWTGRLDQPQASHDLGAWWLTHGNADAALPLLRAAAEGDPRSGSAWRDLALALSRLGRDEEALAVTRHAVTLADDADLWRALDLLEAAAGDVRAARAALERAVKLAPDDPRNQRNLDAVRKRPSSAP